MIARAIGWEIPRIVETREPIIARIARQTPFVTVAPGKVGDELSFGLNYGALLTAMTSEYVKKKTVRKAFTTQLTSEAKSRYAHR
jgi:predicted amino acid racemase